MKKSFISLMGVMAILLNSACSNTIYMGIEVMKPAKVTSAYQSSIALVNNAARKEVAIGTYRNRLNRAEEPVYLDDMDRLAGRLGDTLVSLLKNKNYFSDVKNIEINNLPQIQTTPALLTQIRRESGVANIALFDSLQVNLSIQEDTIKPLFGRHDPYNVLKSDYRISYRVYRPGSDLPERFSVSDTLYWSRFKEEPLPPVGVVLNETFQSALERTIHLFVPYDVTTNRFRFTFNNQYMAEAERKVQKDEWESASVLWNYVYENSKKDNVKAKAASNLGLYYELKDDYDQALLWVKKADDYFKKKPGKNKQILSNMKIWIQELTDRKNEEKNLNIQLSK